jgi:hypothetical protein
MKSNVIKIWGFLTIAAGIILSSCVKDDFDTPPVIVPKVNFPSNMTIAQLKALHSMGTVKRIDSSYVIQGIVTANDESGNFYKTIEIQDATAGIELKLDKTSLYTEFKVGQRVFIKCKDMYMGDYNQLIQLGGLYNGAIGRLTAPEIPLHLFRDSLPGKAPVPEIVTIPTLTDAKVSMLVKFDSVQFDEVGEEFAPQTADATDRHFKDDAGNSIVIRSSKYGNFASTRLPSGKGCVTGILSKYGTTWQVIIRDIKDLSGNFVFSNASTIFSEAFSSTLGQFTGISVTGAQVWTGSTYGATMTGFSGGVNNENEDWLISPAIDLTQISKEASISFSHTINKGDLANLQTNHTLWISKNYTTGDPSTATWEQITIPVYPAGNNWTFVGSGSAVIPASCLGKANVRFAVKYKSSATESATWEIKTLKVVGE